MVSLFTPGREPIANGDVYSAEAGAVILTESGDYLAPETSMVIGPVYLTESGYIIITESGDYLVPETSIGSSYLYDRSSDAAHFPIPVARIATPFSWSVLRIAPNE